LADRPDRETTDLADALRDRIGHSINLVCLFIEQQVVIAEMRAAHVPVEILRLDVQREHVRQDAVHRRGDVFRRDQFQVGRGG
jgi:hypothetical protein